MRFLSQNKWSSFSLIELITALVISGVVVFLVFDLLSKVQKKLVERREFSAIHTDRAILLRQGLKNLHQEAIFGNLMDEPMDYYAFDRTIESDVKLDTLYIQLQTTEIQKINYGLKTR